MKQEEITNDYVSTYFSPCMNMLIIHNSREQKNLSSITLHASRQLTDYSGYYSDDDDEDHDQTKVLSWAHILHAHILRRAKLAGWYAQYATILIIRHM